MDRALRCLPSFEELARLAVTRAVTGISVPCLLVDATAGNGHDTLFLAQLAVQCGLTTAPDLASGQAPAVVPVLAPALAPVLAPVLAIDLQPAALDTTRTRLARHGLAATLMQANHADLRACVQAQAAENALPVAAVMFNLGFLPGSDKAVVTRTPDTLAALTAAADLLMPHGVLTIHAYTGHPGGREEARAVGAWAQALPRKGWRVQETVEANKPENKETLWLMENIQC